MPTSLLQFLRKQIRPHHRTVSYLSVIAIIAAIFDTVIPIVYGRTLDVVINKQPWILIIWLLATWFVLRIITDWMRRIIYERGQEMTFRISLHFMRDAIHHLLALPVSFHLEHHSGDVQDRINRFRNSMERLLNQGLFDLVPGLLTIFIITVYLATIDFRLGLTNVLIIILFFWWSQRLIPALDKAWDEENTAIRKAYSRIWDVVRNISIMKANRAETYEQKATRLLLDKTGETSRELRRLLRSHTAGQDFIFGAGTVALFGFTSYEITNGLMTPGQLATVLGFAFTTWAMVRNFLWVRWEFTSLDSYWKSHAEMREAREETYGIGKKLNIRGGVAFEHVQFRYREDRAVLEDVSFSVLPGQVVALVGESGEGKTTIVELLYRFYEPRSGNILLDGTPVAEIELGHLRSQCAYVPQDLTLFHDSLRQNIRYGRIDATDREIEAAAKMAALHDWVKGLPEGYETVVGERGLKLSAGERQRVAIARAFLRDPKILILDEPTSNLDASTESLIQTSFRELMRGRTTFIIAHRLRTVQEANKILVLKDGRIIEEGSHHDLMERSGEYKRLRDIQFQEAPVQGS